ncbi:GNAT family N-acetyltransferase [Streptomyces sp. NPDC048361]|uniref:GNAT family N-acetyltransferase n=1 Tax=Streptomyces sp. NPDC048361 TaxID=3154720 RepID=UPI003412C4F5
MRDDRARGVLTASEDGEVVGHIDYFTLDARPGVLVVVHTVVEPAHEGKGIASALVREFYAMAAREGAPVVPLCPYAATWASRHPDEAPAAPAPLIEAARARLAAEPERW